jgi:RHS repeat-associated protein
MHADHLGSASLSTDASGSKVSEMRYYPYGETRSGGVFTDRRYTGQREEAGLGLYDYNARYYDPYLNRFISPDTIVPSPANPQSLNRYSYVLNSPLRYTDPTGHAHSQEDGGGGGGIRPKALPNPAAQLIKTQRENGQFILQLIEGQRWSELSEFTSFMQSVHPGSIGIMKWSGRFPEPGDVGHAVLGAGEGVFIGTANAGSDYGVYLSSAAEEYQKYRGTHQLSIHEVQGITAQQRQIAAEYALEQYGAGYSYEGAVMGHRDAGADKEWYCSELTVAALEKAGVTFYSGNGVLYMPVNYPTFPTSISGYRTRTDSGAPTVITRWASDPLAQTWSR